MKKFLLIISFIVFILVDCDSQIKRELESIFLGFPLNGSLQEIKKYCMTNDFQTEPSIYDSNKTDFIKKITYHSKFEKEGNGFSLEAYHSFKAPIDGKIIENALIISLTVYFSSDSIGIEHYSDTIGSPGKIYERLVSLFEDKLKHHRAGEFLDPNMKIVADYTLFHLNCLYPSRYLIIEKWSNRISINYLKQYPK